MAGGPAQGWDHQSTHGRGLIIADSLWTKKAVSRTSLVAAFSRRPNSPTKFQQCIIESVGPTGTSLESDWLKKKALWKTGILVMMMMMMMMIIISTIIIICHKWAPDNFGLDSAILDCSHDSLHLQLSTATPTDFVVSTRYTCTYLLTYLLSHLLTYYSCPWPDVLAHHHICPSAEYRHNAPPRRYWLAPSTFAAWQVHVCWTGGVRLSARCKAVKMRASKVFLALMYKLFLSVLFGLLLFLMTDTEYNRYNGMLELLQCKILFTYHLIC